MKTLDLAQGSDEWLAARLDYLGASKAPMMMGDSKFMSRGQLLDLKKGWQANPNPYFLEKLFAKGHEHEAMAREVTELEHCEDFPPLVGLADVGLAVELIASYDGLNSDNLVWEHKDWNLVLAANVRNGILEASYYWQLEHQMLVADADEVLFTCSDGGDENRISMTYISVPERREAIIKGWKQFLVDLELHELEAKSESILETKKENFPGFQCSVVGSQVITNIREFIPLLKMKAEEQLSLVLVTDKDFADKDAFNKLVKKSRANLKAEGDKIEAEFISLAEFTAFKKEADSILQKMQSHGERQVKESKEAKKNSIITNAQMTLANHLGNLSAGIDKVQITQIVINWNTVIKGKRSILKMQDAVDVALAGAKIEANEIAEVIRKNLTSFSELASEHKFLFSDRAMLLLKSNDDLINLIKNRITEHDKSEAERLEQERTQIRKEE